MASCGVGRNAGGSGEHVHLLRLPGEVLLRHPWDLSQPEHHEGHRGVCGREGAGQAAVFPEGDGTQAEQGGVAERGVLGSRP